LSSSCGCDDVADLHVPARDKDASDRADGAGLEEALVLEKDSSGKGAATRGNCLTNPLARCEQEST
jgi:hypothetical protein